MSLEFTTCTRCGKIDSNVQFNHGLCTSCYQQVKELEKGKAEIYAKTLRENSPEEVERREAANRAFIVFVFVAGIWLISLPLRLIGFLVKKSKEHNEKVLAEYEKENPTEFHKLHKSIKDAYEYWKSKPSYEFLPFSIWSEYALHLSGTLMGGICFVGVWRLLYIRYSIPEETTLRLGIFLGILWYIVFIRDLIVKSKRHKTFLSWVLYSSAVQKAVDFIKTHSPDNNDFSNEYETKKNIFRLMEHRRAFPEENNQSSLVKYVFDQQKQFKLFKYDSAAQYVNFSLRFGWIFVLFSMAAFDLFFGGGLALVLFLLWVGCKRKQYFKLLHQYKIAQEEEQKVSTADQNMKTSEEDTISNNQKSTCHCPCCGELLEVSPDWDGLQAECPSCNNTFIIKI